MEIKFGTSGWRAIIGDGFTFDNVRLVTTAIAQYIKSLQRTRGTHTKRGSDARRPTVVVGYDTRFMSEDFALECAKVLAENGIQPLLTKEDVPTPVIAYEIIRRKADGGINFTASHNPCEYNGIKFSPSYGGPAFPEITDKIEKNIRTCLQQNLIRKIKPQSTQRTKKDISIRYINPEDTYIKRIKELVSLKALRRLKIVADPLYGTGRHYLEKILQISDCKFQILHNWRDVIFGGGRPEPDEETLRELIAKVKSTRANIGISTDGDADRFGIIDADGTYYNPNAVITLLLYHLYKTRGWKDIVVRTVATTHMIDALCKKYGLEVTETPVGFKYIAEVMQKRDILIGGEESGGLTIHGHIPEKDGILAGLLMAEMVATEKKTLGKIMNNLYKEVGLFLSSRVNLKLTAQMDKILKVNLSRSIREIAGLKVLKKITIDGTKLLLEDGSWILFRFSGTEPVVRIYAEADNRKKLNVLINAGQKMAQ
ncbi:hypothetical protein AUJ66_01620 [Candidatus Desantisbacteria bacterium CG1_02_38_46]|nr:MAG: hypothetical protein AUJ66_01620 [Candidatus Desantisbacteria bacterium CG1_02_38_46]